MSLCDLSKQRVGSRRRPRTHIQLSAAAPADCQIKTMCAGQLCEGRQRDLDKVLTGAVATEMSQTLVITWLSPVAAGQLPLSDKL